MILAAPLVIPFAEAVGISIATLGMAKAADMVNDYIQENPEQSAMILKTLVPNLGIGEIFMKKGKDEEVEEDIEVEDVDARDLTKKEKAKKMKELAKSGASREKMIKGYEEIILPGKEDEMLDEAEDRYEGGVEEVSKPKFDYKKFFKKRYANGGSIGIEVLFEEKKPKTEYKMQGGVKNYKPSKMVKAPVTAKSSPDTPTAHLAYITPEEQDILIDLNLYGSLKGKPNRGPSGIPSLEGDFGGPGGFGGFEGGGGGRQDNDVSGSRDTGTGDYRQSKRAADVAARKEYEKNRAIREANERAADVLAGRDPRLSGGIRTGRGPISGAFASILGMMMGIPGLGLLTGGLGSLKNKFNDVTNNPNDLSLRERLTGYKTQKEYDDARRDRQLQGRLDNMYSAKSKGKGFSQKNIDKIEAMGFSPSTAQNVLTGRDLKGFTPSRMGLQTTMTPMAKPMTPMAKPTFSDPFANTVGTTTKVNAPANDAVSSYSYGKVNAAIPGIQPNTPSYINEFLNKPITPGKSLPGTNFLDSLYNADLINQLGYQAFKNYPSDSAIGPLSDARHMAAMNELSNSLSPMDNKFGNFIGDTLAYGAGAINEVPALFRGFNKENFDAIKEDLAANYAGTYGTPNTTTAQQIYNQVFDTNKFASTGFADGGLVSMFVEKK